MGITRKIEPKNQKEPDSSAVLHTQSTYPEPLSVNVYSSSSFQNSGDDPSIPPATSSSPLQRLSADPASPAPAFLPNNTHVHVPSNLCPCCVSPSSPSKLQQDTPSQTVAVVSLPLLPTGPTGPTTTSNRDRSQQEASNRTASSSSSIPFFSSQKNRWRKPNHRQRPKWINPMRRFPPTLPTTGRASRCLSSAPTSSSPLSPQSIASRGRTMDAPLSSRIMMPSRTSCQTFSPRARSPPLSASSTCTRSASAAKRATGSTPTPSSSVAAPIFSASSSARKRESQPPRPHPPPQTQSPRQTSLLTPPGLLPPPSLLCLGVGKMPWSTSSGQTWPIAAQPSSRSRLCSTSATPRSLRSRTSSLSCVLESSPSSPTKRPFSPSLKPSSLPFSPPLATTTTTMAPLLPLPLPPTPLRLSVPSGSAPLRLPSRPLPPACLTSSPRSLPGPTTAWSFPCRSQSPRVPPHPPRDLPKTPSPFPRSPLPRSLPPPSSVLPNGPSPSPPLPLPLPPPPPLLLRSRSRSQPGWQPPLRPPPPPLPITWRRLLLSLLLLESR